MEIAAGMLAAKKPETRKQDAINKEKLLFTTGPLVGM